MAGVIDISRGIRKSSNEVSVDHGIQIKGMN